jgi:hypothetical protein
MRDNLIGKWTEPPFHLRMRLSEGTEELDASSNGLGSDVLRSGGRGAW